MRLARPACILCALGCAALAGCESTSPHGDSTPGVQVPKFFSHTTSRSSADDLAAYLGKLRGMNENAIAAEAARQKRAAAARNADDLQRLRAAIALSLSPQGEDAEVIALADPIARREGADPNARAMASFLVLFSTERRRLREGASAARMSLREEKRAVETQKQRADALQERADALQQKLDALSALEKSLTDRPPPAQ